jgi:PTS system nitrogen regulatory IIA component
MNLHDYLSADNVLFLETENRNDTIHALVQKASESGYIEDAEEFEEAVFERESIMSTGMGLNVAVPHAKLGSVREFFILIGITKGGVDWRSLDQQPVRIVFLIGGPSDQQKLYLTILSKLMLVIKNSVIRDTLLSATNRDDVVKPFLKV